MGKAMVNPSGRIWHGSLKPGPAMTVLGLVLLVYGATAVPDLTWAFHSGDGGELMTAVVTGGIPHPPGYPTYLLLGRLAVLLPVDPIAYRFSLFSAIAGALAAAVTTTTAPALGLSGWRATLPGFTLAFIPLVWQQAVITEVYALNLALVAAVVWSLLSKRPSWLSGLLLGIGLTTHLTSILLLPLALLLLPQKEWLKMAGGLAIGLMPFLFLPLLVRPDSPVIWGRPQTATGWWWLVSSQIYRPNQLALPAQSIGPRLADWGLILLRQLLFIGWPLLLWTGWKEEKRKIWLGLVGTAVLYFLYALFYNAQDAIVFTLPAWLLLSLALAPAFKQANRWLMLLPFALILLNFRLITTGNYQNIRPIAEQILNGAPANAILVTSGDPDIFTLWYFHFVEGQRPDLIVVDDQLFAFDWYREQLQTRYPKLQGLAVDDVANFQAANAGSQPVCRVAFSNTNSLVASNSCITEH